MKSLIRYIILPLHSNVYENTKELLNNKEYPTLGINELFTFIFWVIQTSDNIYEEIVIFTEDWLLNDPDGSINKSIINKNVNLLTKLTFNIKNNLTQYGVPNDTQLQFEFDSFLSETEILLRKS